MFTQLLASRPVRQKSTGGLVASIVLHLGVATGVVYLTTQTLPQVVAKDPAVPLVYRPPEPPERVIRVTTEPPTVAPPDVLAVAPSEIAVTLPPLAPLAAPTVDRSFVPGATISTVTTPIATRVSSPVPTGVFRAEQVEVPVSLLRDSPKPGYPAMLVSTGIEGTARFRFVVDATGRVEMATVEQIAASHSAFAMAVRATLPRMRFTPARVDGNAVRQLVELPFEFRSKR
jgi:protein TonB